VRTQERDGCYSQTDIDGAAMHKLDSLLDQFGTPQE
jgi:hypothetical protein